MVFAPIFLALSFPALAMRHIEAVDTLSIRAAVLTGTCAPSGRESKSFVLSFITAISYLDSSATACDGLNHCRESYNENFVRNI